MMPLHCRNRSGEIDAIDASGRHNSKDRNNRSRRHHAFEHASGGVEIVAVMTTPVAWGIGRRSGVGYCNRRRLGRRYRPVCYGDRNSKDQDQDRSADSHTWTIRRVDSEVNSGRRSTQSPPIPAQAGARTNLLKTGSALPAFALRASAGSSISPSKPFGEDGPRGRAEWSYSGVPASR